MNRRATLGLALLTALSACASGRPAPHSEAQRSSTQPSASQPSAMQPSTPGGKPRILLATTSHTQKGNTGQPTGAYLGEVAHPYEVFTQAGYQVELASVRGGEIPLDGLDKADALSLEFLDEQRGALASSIAAQDVEAGRYEAIYFAGGHGAMWDLPGNAAFQRVTVALYERGGVVAAVCHGPAALVNVKLSSGRYLVSGMNVSAFTNEEEKAVGLDTVVPFLLADALEERGAHHQPAPDWQKQVVVSGRLVTGQNPASAAGVAEAVVELLEPSKSRPAPPG